MSISQAQSTPKAAVAHALQALTPLSLERNLLLLLLLLLLLQC
jgi:hypothetical protein